MKRTLRQLILNEAIRIGDELLAKAETGCQGLSWKTLDQQGESIRWH